MQPDFDAEDVAERDLGSQGSCLQFCFHATASRKPTPKVTIFGRMTIYGQRVNASHFLPALGELTHPASFHLGLMPHKAPLRLCPTRRKPKRIQRDTP